jgi:hypothetical protein
MTILETTRQIIQKHKLDEKLSFNPFKDRGQNYFSNHEKFKDSYEKTTNLQNKYENRVPQEWYGLDCSCWPINWLNALEEFLAELEKDSPCFEIHQIKLKYGMARIHLGNLSAEAWKAVDEFENAMSDENLIY